MSQHPIAVEDPRALLRRHGLRPKHSWGQNFLTNLKLVDRIADEVAAANTDLVIEIGAGVGTLTTALAQRVPRLIAIERDPDLVDLLARELDLVDGRLELVDCDALAFDYREASAGASVAIVGNLPYQLTGRLLRTVIQHHDLLTASVVMIQQEVADRLVAQPGTASYGVLSIMAQAWLEPTILWRVSPGSFHPRPKVGSAVVRLKPLPTPRVGSLSEETFSRVVHAAFSARRKTLRNSLKAAFEKTTILDALAAVNIDPGLRAEVLTIEQLAALTRQLIDFID